MKNEELISKLIEFPLDADVEDCHPVVVDGTVYLRTGCNQTSCKRENEAKARVDQLSSILEVICDKVVYIGKMEGVPVGAVKELRRLYSLMKKAGFECWRSVKGRKN